MQYCAKNPDKLLRDRKKSPDADVEKKTFGYILDMKYMKSVIDPGEAVGIIAGQSVGEPSTQMTLNTFHLAGHSAKNVTMGIPRLREIVMTASQNISTPSMTIHMIPEMGEEASKIFAKGITKVTIAEVIDYVEVVEKIEQKSPQEREKVYDIRLTLFNSKEYEEAYAIKVEDIPRAIERNLIPVLIKAIENEFKRQKDSGFSNSAGRLNIGESSGTIQEAPSHTQADHQGEDDDDDEDEENDATNTKQKQNRDEAVSYAAPDEQEEAIAKQARRDTTADPDEDEGFYGSPRESQKQAVDADSDDNDQRDGDADRINVNLDAMRLERLREQAGYSELTKFSFDNDRGEWCKIRLQVKQPLYSSENPNKKLIVIPSSTVRSDRPKTNHAQPRRKRLPQRQNPSHPKALHMHLHTRKHARPYHRRQQQNARHNHPRRQPARNAQLPKRPKPSPALHQRPPRHAQRLRRRSRPRHRRARNGRRLQSPQHRRQRPPPRPHRRRHDAQRRAHPLHPHRHPRLHEPIREDELRDDGRVLARRGS